MSQSLREEFRLSALGFRYPDPSAFVQSQWRCRWWVYLTWRAVWLLWHVAIIVASAVNFWDKLADSTHEGSKWFVFYPHITFLLTALACTCDLIGAVRAGRPTSPPSVSGGAGAGKADKEEILFHGEFFVLKGLKEASTPGLSQLTWFLYSIVNSSNILATAWFWAVTHDSHTYAVEMVAHVINSVFVISNLLVSAMPVRLVHCLYPVLYTSLYIAFTAIYHAAGGTDHDGRSTIYRELDWDDAFPTAVTVVLGLLVVLPLLHCVVFAVFTFRVYLHSRLNSASYSPEVMVKGVRYQDRSRGQEAMARIDSAHAQVGT